jgi:hypothetical protein
MSSTSKASAERGEFEEAMNSLVSDISTEVSILKDQLKLMTDEPPAHVLKSRQMADVEEAIFSFKHKLRKLRSRTEEPWQDLKDELDKEAVKLTRAWKRLRDHLENDALASCHGRSVQV